MKKYLNWTQLETQVHLLCNNITESIEDEIASKMIKILK